MSELFYLCFPLKSFIVASLTFESLTHFKFIFVYGGGKCSFHCFTCGCPVFPALLIEEAVFFSIV